MVDDDTYEQAKTQLEAAITAYYSAVEPDAYVSAWVLVTHKESIELAHADQSAVEVLIKTGQAFPMTRGILDVALETERRGQQRRE